MIEINDNKVEYKLDGKIHLITKNNCIQCTMTKKVMTNYLKDMYKDHVVEYNLEEHPQLLTWLRDEMNIMEAPVVFYQNEHWSGFNDDKTKAALHELILF